MTRAHGEQLYQRILENLDRAVIVVDREQRITVFNPAAQEYTGYSERQAKGKLAADLFPGQTELLNLMHQAAAHGRIIADNERLQLQRNFADPLPISASVSPLLDRDGHPDGAILILRDMGRVHELEEAVRNADRLSMLGTLAAGLAHEIKNPLGGIKGAAQLLKMELTEQNPLCEYTEVMVKESERINGIIEELLNLSRPRQAEWGEVSLTRILNDIVLFQREAFRSKGVQFDLQLDPSIPAIQGDENLLTRLFINLVKNAAEAAPISGEVVIRSRIGAEVHLNQPGSRPVPFVVVEVKDNGEGIPDDVKEQIFTPFFTSKESGTGLGLVTCQKIVNEHRGFIKLRSRIGKGTTLTVSLPFIRCNEFSETQRDEAAKGTI
ncbi:MAG: PAS domain-containing sensor histidine kinase [Desulfuromonas sp.]|nr:MAG: PAS domain-containing sensor histidine kinase [Desulfuromonas sp.]